LLDAVLALSHILAIFGVVAALTAQAVLLRPGLTPSMLARLSNYDLAYFLMAMLALGTGACRLLWGVKGMPFYLGNPWFYAKICLFVGIGLVSISPTRAYLRWRKQASRLPDFVPLPTELAHIRRWVLVELHLFTLIPVCAILMARGIGVA
jgi:putative membrane protein